MKDLFAPNRVAVYAAIATALGGALATILGAVDTPAKAIVVSVALIAIAAVIVVYLLGSQEDEARKFDALTPVQANAVALATAPDVASAAPRPADAGATAVVAGRSQVPDEPVAPAGMPADVDTSVLERADGDLETPPADLKGV